MIKRLPPAACCLDPDCDADRHRHRHRQLLAKRVAESVTLVTALPPIIGYEKAAPIAKTASAGGGPIAEMAESLGIMSRSEMHALLVP